MKLAVGTEITYSSAAGENMPATIREIYIADAGDGKPQTWMVLDVFGALGYVTIPAGRGCIEMFKIALR